MKPRSGSAKARFLSTVRCERLAGVRGLLVASLLAAQMVVPWLPAAPDESKGSPVEIVLVAAEMVTPAAVSQWKKEHFRGVAMILDERTSKAAYRDAGRHVLEGALDLYCWVEVARNPKMAEAHPQWMAALGSHEDWQRSFPNFPEPGVGEVPKAFPWVPIGYREAFDAHLARVEQLLERAPAGWRALLLNDLQGGPSSCGCGNLQCRWALDYHMRPTATKLNGDDIAARFTAEIRKRVGGKTVVPVWTTECAEVDLPPDKHQGRPGTGLCGTVGCATGACSDVFTRQWTALTSDYNGPVGLLAVHTALQRTQKEFGGGPSWVTNVVAYLNQTLPVNGGKSIAPDRLWVVVEGLQSAEEVIARDLAARAGVGAVIVARSRIDQSYEPRIFRPK